MVSSIQKIFSKSLSSIKIIALTLLLGTTGCNFFRQSKPQVIETYCEKHFELKKNEKIREDLLTISAIFFEYVKVNETTFQCDCPASKPEQEKQQCYADFLKLENKK